MFAVLVVFGGSAWGQELPAGPGKDETQRLCKNCHELSQVVSFRKDWDGWQLSVDKMIAQGAKLTDQEYELIIDYLAKNFPAAELPKLNVNKATAVEFESRLTLTRSQAAAIIEHRTKNGPFKTLEDLKKVPGIDTAKIDAKKDHLVF